MEKALHLGNSKLLMWLSLLLFGISIQGYAQDKPIEKKKSMRKAGVYSSLPSGYQQVGNTKLYYTYSTKKNNAVATNYGSIDIVGKYGSSYYTSTYYDAGYRVAMQVDNYSAVNVNCKNGTTNNGVTITSSVEQQGELARIVYHITNNNSTDKTVSVGVHADVMIGDNDQAPISRRIDREGKTYGLTMKHGSNTAQLCVLLGSGLTGVTSVDDFWFGTWSKNRDPSQMVGSSSYDTSGNWMVENGSYDSGMGWCWKNRPIPAGMTIQFSWIIGVGEVNLEPSTTFTVTPTDLSIWNDIAQPHTFMVEGYFESPFGQNGYIEYSAEDSEEWITINTTPIPSGTNFTEYFTTTFDPERTTHELRFRTRDFVGNTTMLPTSSWPDISFYPVTGIQDYTYTGSAITQTNLTYNFGDIEWASRYTDNVNVGTAHYIVEGVYPNSIGRSDYPFTINPQPLEGALNVTSPYAYTGNPITPSWSFTVDRYNSLVQGTDYKVDLASNILPGTATITITGLGNYTDKLTGTFQIVKANPTYNVNVPDDVIYDGEPRGATATTNSDGTLTIYYTKHGETNYTTNRPIAVGKYDVYIEISESDFYYSLSKTYVGTFSIKKIGMTPNIYNVDVPDDVDYDGQPHGASGSTTSTGTLTIYYTTHGGSDYTQTAPTAPGTYDVYVEISESDLYEGLARTLVGTFTIRDSGGNEPGGGGQGGGGQGGGGNEGGGNEGGGQGGGSNEGGGQGGGGNEGGGQGGGGNEGGGQGGGGNEGGGQGGGGNEGGGQGGGNEGGGQGGGGNEGGGQGGGGNEGGGQGGGISISTTDDNSETLDDNDGETTDVTIEGLTMRPYTWNTLCVPFNATMDQIKAALGEEADVEELVSSTYDVSTMLLTLYFTPRTEIVAGMPYVVKVATDITNPTFTGVTITNVEPETIVTTFSSMTGDYNPTPLTPGDRNTLFISDNHFYYPSTAGPLPATKCWFTLLGEAKQDNNNYGIKGISLTFDEAPATSIFSIKASSEVEDEGWYTMQGVRVTTPQKGIYIYKGKKVFVK